MRRGSGSAGSLLSASLRPQSSPRRAVPSCPGVQCPYVAARAVAQLGRGRFPELASPGPAGRCPPPPPAEGRPESNSLSSLGAQRGSWRSLCCCPSSLLLCVCVCLWPGDVRGCEMLLGNFCLNGFCTLTNIVIPFQTPGVGCHVAQKVLHLDRRNKEKLLGSSRFEFCLGLLDLVLLCLEGAHRQEGFWLFTQPDGFTCCTS